MITTYPQSLTDDQIIYLLKHFSNNSSNYEKRFIKLLISAENKEGIIDDLYDIAIEHGEEIKTHFYTFDINDNPYLAEICPDGVSGFIALYKFCSLFFVRYEQYGEGQDVFGPWRSIEEAGQAFAHAVVMNDPG